MHLRRGKHVASRKGAPVTVLIRGGRVLDQTGERVADLLVADGLVSAVGHDLGTADRRPA